MTDNNLWVDPSSYFKSWPDSLPCTYGPYKGIVATVSDGDTFWAFVDVGFRKYEKVPIRLFGIDSPEKGAKGGSAATSFLEELLPPGTLVQITARASDRSRRWVSDVLVDMTGRGYAIPSEDGFSEITGAKSVAWLCVVYGHALYKTY